MGWTTVACDDQHINVNLRNQEAVKSVKAKIQKWMSIPLETFVLLMKAVCLATMRRGFPG